MILYASTVTAAGAAVGAASRARKKAATAASRLNVTWSSPKDKVPPAEVAKAEIWTKVSGLS
jgi:hypothetical protein